MTADDHALLHDRTGRARIVRLEPAGRGFWRAVDIEREELPHLLEPWEIVHPHEIASRRLTLAEAQQALKEWEAAYSLSQSYVVRPYSPLRAWNDKWG